MSRSRNSGVYVAAAKPARSRTGSVTSARFFAERVGRSRCIAVEPPNEVHLGLELDAGRAPDPVPDQTDQRPDGGRGGVGTGHDEGGGPPPRVGRCAAPALISPAPAGVAGTATPNPGPLSLCRSATPASAGSGIAAPPPIRSRSRAAQRYPFPSRSTSPKYPSSETRTFDPLPITVKGIAASPTARLTIARSSSRSGSR